MNSIGNFWGQDLSVAASLPPLREGDMLGEYRIVSNTVNAGGFGRIYKAKVSRALGRERVYAIKEFCLNALTEESRTQLSMLGFGEQDMLRFGQGFLEAFKNESRILRELGRSCRDRHIPEVTHQARLIDGRWCYAMEYVDAPTLTDYVNTHGCMTETEALNHIVQISKVLYTMHRWNVTHCDVSPNNIMVRGKYTMLVDFGNVRYYQGLINQESASYLLPPAGTYGYAPPSEIVGTAAGDVYSLAATMFFMLTGECPKLRETYNLQLMQDHQVSGDTCRAILDTLRGETLSVRDFLVALPSEAVFDILLEYSAYDYKNGKRQKGYDLIFA